MRWLDYFINWSPFHVVQKAKQSLIPVKNFFDIDDIRALERLKQTVFILHHFAFMSLYIFYWKFEHKKLAITISATFKNFILAILIECVYNCVIKTRLLFAKVCICLIKFINNFWLRSQTYLFSDKLLKCYAYAVERISCLIMLAHMFNCHCHCSRKSFPAWFIIFLRNATDVTI